MLERHEKVNKKKRQKLFLGKVKWEREEEWTSRGQLAHDGVDYPSSLFFPFLFHRFFFRFYLFVFGTVILSVVLSTRRCKIPAIVSLKRVVAANVARHVGVEVSWFQPIAKSPKKLVLFFFLVFLLLCVVVISPLRPVVGGVWRAHIGLTRDAFFPPRPWGRNSGRVIHF